HHPPTTQPHPLSLHDALPISSARASTYEVATRSDPAAPGSLTSSARSAPMASALRIPSSAFSGPSETSTTSPSPAASLIFSASRSEEHTSELQSPYDLVCRLL